MSRAIFTHPHREPTVEAVELFKDEAIGPCQLAQRRNTRQKEVLIPITNVKTYTILPGMTEDDTSGKRTLTGSTDLSSCCAFHIGGKASILSPAHVD